MEKLTETENFRLTKSEKELLGTLAADIEVSKSDYLRHVINNREKPKIVVKGESEEVIPMSGTVKLVLILCILITVALGIFPDVMSGGW